MTERPRGVLRVQSVLSFYGTVKTISNLGSSVYIYLSGSNNVPTTYHGKIIRCILYCCI